MHLPNSHNAKINLNPQKLKNSKWTAALPQNKEKHFMVVKVITPILAATQITEIELQAVYSGRSFILPWRDLTDSSQWLQGWL